MTLKKKYKLERYTIREMDDPQAECLASDSSKEKLIEQIKQYILEGSEYCNAPLGIFKLEEIVTFSLKEDIEVTTIFSPEEK